MKLINIILFVFLTYFGYSQYCPYLGPNQYLPCGTNSTTLTADLSQCSAGNNPNQTTNYNVSTIPYVAQTNTGNTVQLTDDSQTGPFNIGFNFCFFGNTYTQFWIGSNGWISFTAGQPTTFTSATIPSAGATIPKNCIMGPWQDWNPGIGGQIRYQVQGTAPCRKLVVSWINVPMFSCTSTLGTFHIVIYESTNYIESHIVNKPNCLQWAGGTAVQGIHNLAGTTAIPAPGRNSTQWTANNDARRWTPSGPAVTPTLTWYQVGNPNPIGTGPTITVTPPAQGANYTCHFVYPTCNAGWSSCNSGGGLGPDTVFVLPGPANLNQPTVAVTNPVCTGDCNGTITITPTNGTSPFNYTWPILTQTGPSQTGFCAGSYNITVTDANGCNVTTTATLIDPPLVTTGPITFSDTICFNSPNEIYSVPSQPGYTFNWNSVGNIISGQGTNQIITNWNGINSGTINGGVQVTATNSVGCTSSPISINLFILNILPVIDSIGPFCEYDECITLNAIPSNGVFTGNNVLANSYCPDNGFIGLDTIVYTYIQSGCLFDTNINVQVYPRPLITPIVGGGFYEICEGDTVTGTYSTIFPTIGYNEWTFLGQTYQSNNFNITWSSSGTFYLSVVHWENGCVSSQELTSITVVRCPELLYYIPNTFTPDADEHNQMFTPIFTSGFDPYNFNMKIFNKWGQIIFETNSSTEGWDGTYKNNSVQTGVYNYTIEFKDKNTDKKYSLQGHVNLIK